MDARVRCNSHWEVSGTWGVGKGRGGEESDAGPGEWGPVPSAHMYT